MGALRAALAAAALLWSAPSNADAVARWNSEIAQASARFGIPQQWIRRVMRAESGGQLLRGGEPIVSAAGAIGLMQLMPGTWGDMRSLLRLGSDPNDPHDNIVAGTAYLRLLYDRFGYPGLFAAYNAGPRRYASYLTGQGPLPAETRSYVAAVAGPSHHTSPSPATSAIIARQPAGDQIWAAPNPFATRPHGLFVQLGAEATNRFKRRGGCLTAEYAGGRGR